VGQKISQELKCDLYLPEKLIEEEDLGIKSYNSSTAILLKEIWDQYDGIICVFALGIVMRIVSPMLENKYEDPAVVVVDEMGRYAISALSGHEGGANRLAEKVALICQGDFVVTTGSEATRNLIIGMGCRRGTSAERLEETLMEGLQQANRTLTEVRLITSVEDKKDEQGFHELSEKLGIPLKFIEKNLIKEIEHNFEPSELVNKTLGVSSVAEPCATLGGFRCQLIQKKIKRKDSTIAIAEERFL